MEPAGVPEPFDRRYRAAGYVAKVSLASENGVAINEHSARSARALSASRLSSRKPEA